MKSVAVVALVALVSGASASSAWTQFVNHEENTEAFQAASRRLLFSGSSGVPIYQEFRGVGFVQSSGPEVPAAQKRFFTTNSFINGNCDAPATPTASSMECVKQKVFALCHNGAEGTSFYTTVTAAWKGKASSGNWADAMPPQCTQCLSQGWGTSEATPGFYLPCGGQGTCVDVSGRSERVFAATSVKAGSTVFPPTSSSYMVPQVAATASSRGTPLATCQDYIATNIVATTTQMNIYHFVLWISLIASITLVFTAYSMMNMQLDMDSLLYTVGSSSKKND